MGKSHPEVVYVCMYACSSILSLRIYVSYIIVTLLPLAPFNKGDNKLKQYMVNLWQVYRKRV